MPHSAQHIMAKGLFGRVAGILTWLDLADRLVVDWLDVVTVGCLVVPGLRWYSNLATVWFIWLSGWLKLICNVSLP